MEDKELLAAWEKIEQLYGPQKRTFDEFKFQMQSNEYRKKVYGNLGDNAKDVFGYDNFDQFNADKFLPAPSLPINDTPNTADNLPRFNAASSTFVDQSTDFSRSTPSYNADGSAGRMPTLYDRMSEEEKADIEFKNIQAKKSKRLERAKLGAATTSDVVSADGDFYDVIRNYSEVTGENLLASQLDYNDGKLSGIAKGQFEQKAMNLLSEDMFAIIDDTENSQVWQNYGEEYGFLINQINAQSKEINTLQDKLAVTEDPQEKQVIINAINDLLDQGAEYSKETPNKTGGVDNKRFTYTSMEEMQKRFTQLNSLPEFKNYQRAINILHKVRDVSENFDQRNPEFVQNQKDLESAQVMVDAMDKAGIQIPNLPGQAQGPKWINDNFSKPIMSSLIKAADDVLSLPRTLAFNDDYGWTDALAEWSNRTLSKEMNPMLKVAYGQSSNKERGIMERVAEVDGYQLVLSDDIFENRRTPQNVRDKDGYLIQDPKIVSSVIDKYEKNPEQYEDENQINYGGVLPKFTGVMADLGILMFGTKGLGTGVKAVGGLGKATKVGNYLSKSTVANRIGLTGAVTGQTHNGLYAEAIRQGLSPSEASAFAMTGSLTVAAVAQINPQFYLIGEKKAASELTKRYIEYLARGGKESNKAAFKYAMKEVFGAGRKEMFEELAEIPALNAARAGFNEFLTPDKQFEIDWSRNEIVESTVFGLAAGTATGPMNITSQSALQQQATYAAYKAKDKFFNRMNDMVGEQYMDPDTGNMLYYTQEQADAKKTQFSNLFRQLDAAKLSTNKLSEETEVKLLSLFQNSNNIKRLMDQAEGNPALMKVLEAQYAVNNDAIAETLEENRKPVQPKAEPKAEPKSPPSDGTSSTPVNTESTEAIDNEIDEALNNDPDNVLNGRVKPEPKADETVTEPTKTEGDQAVETETNTEPPVDTKTTSKTGTVIEPGVVKIESQEQFEALENALLKEDMTDEELEQLGFKREPYYDPGNDIQRTHKNLKIDITGTPVFEEVNLKGKPTGRKYHRLFSSTQKGVGYYVPVGQEIYIDELGTTRPTDVEGNRMGDGTYMSDSMFVQPEGTQTSTETNTEPKKPFFSKDELTTGRATGDYLTPLINRLQENFPNVEIVLDAKAVEDLALSQGISPEMAKQAKGVYNATTGQVLINPKTANKDTPIHEIAHVWTRIAKEERPELWKRGMELMEGSDIVKNLRKQIANNPDLQKAYTEDKILDEALAIAIGQRGANIFENQEQQGVWNNWIQEFFDFLKNKFNIQSDKDIQDLTLREFVELASTEILTGQKMTPSNRVDLNAIKKRNSVEIKDNGKGQLSMININTGKEVSRPTRRKIEKEILEHTEFPVEAVLAATELKDLLDQDALDRGSFYDPVEAEFIGYKVSRKSFVQESDKNNIGNTLARGWFSSEGRGLDVIAMEVEEAVYGGEYNASAPRVEVQDLIDIMLNNPANYLAVPQEVKDAKERFLEQTGITPTIANVEAMLNKDVDESSSMNPVFDEDFGVDEDAELPFMLFQANYVDPVTGIEMSFDKNTNKFKLLEETGYITKNKTLEDFAGVNMIIHQPDFAFSGQISRDGELIVEGKGGMYYPIKFHDSGYFWASTKGGASIMEKGLNQALAKNNGKVYMALITAPPSKLLSSTTGSNGVVDLFTSEAFQKKMGLRPNSVKRALVEAANKSVTKEVKGKKKVIGLNAGASNRFNLAENLKLIRTKLASDESTFQERLQFSETFLDEIAKVVNNSDSSKKSNKKLVDFFKNRVGFENMKATGGRVSKANLVQAVSYMFAEPMLRKESETDKVYAVLEIDGKVEQIKSDAHESYPKALRSAEGSRTKLHILKGRTDWRSSFADPVTDQRIEEGIDIGRADGKSRKFSQLLPPSAGLTFEPLRVLNKDEGIADETSFQVPTGMDLTQDQVNEALKTDKTAQRIISKGIKPEVDQNVGIRLNLNVFKNTGVPVQAIHKGTISDAYMKVDGVAGNFRGEVINYAPAVTIKNAHFNTHQKSIYQVKNKIKNKFPLASVDGKYQDIPFDQQDYTGTELRFNPMNTMLFETLDGKPVRSAEEATVIGTKVFARGKIEYFTEENKPQPYSPPGDVSFQIEGDTNKKQIQESIQRLKEQGKFTEQQLVDYYNRRFPDISRQELGDMYNGTLVPEESPRSEKRKYTSRLEQVLSEETFEALSEEAKTYIPKRNNITDAEAQAMFDGLGLEESLQVVKQNPDYLLPEVRVALANKVIKGLEAEVVKLRGEGKTAEANVISTGLTGLIEQLSTEGTKAGKFIQSFKMLDALSTPRTIALINKKLKDAGKEPLTKEQEAEITRLKKVADEAAEGLPKSTAMAEQYKYMNEIVGTEFKSLFEAYFYASILSGTTTQIRNIMANVMSIGNELLVTSIREAIMGNPGAIINATEGLIKGLSKGWLNAKNILQTGVKSDRSDKFDAPVLLEWWRFNTNNKVLDKLLNSKFLPWSPNFLKYVQRAMVAGDQMFFHSAKEMQSRALASRIKKGKNVTPEDIKRAESILEPSTEVKEKAKATAKSEGYTEGSTQFKIRVHELIEQQRDQSIQGQSEDFAAKTTFNYEPEGALSYLYNFIVSSRQMPGIGPVMTTFIPFARVLTNVFNRFLHYTPVGAVTAARGKTRVASGKTRILSSEEKADLYIKSTIGMSTLSGLVAYLMSHLDDDDAVLKISAAGPKDFNKKYELQKAGWKPFTITVGDVSVSYQDHPLYFILAAAGTLAESQKYGNSVDAESNADLFTYVALSTSMSMLGQSWLQGLSDLGRILNSDDPAKAVTNKVFGVASSIAIPNFHKQLIRQSMEILGDPIKARRTGTLTGAIDQLYRDIPIANSGLYDMVDNYGDPVIPEQGQKFIPLDIRIGDKGDPLAKHLTDEGVFVGAARNRKVEVWETGESRYLDGDEYQVYKMESAKAVGKALREQHSYLKSLKGEELGQAVSDIKKAARDQAFYELFYGDKYKRITKKK